MKIQGVIGQKLPDSINALLRRCINGSDDAKNENPMFKIEKIGQVALDLLTKPPKHTKPLYWVDFPYIAPHKKPHVRKVVRI